jgi:hypothetical protein
MLFLTTLSKGDGMSIRVLLLVVGFICGQGSLDRCLLLADVPIVVAFFDLSIAQGGTDRFIKRNERDLHRLLKASAHHCDDPHTIFSIAQIYEQLGNWPEAFVWYERRSQMLGRSEAKKL